MAVLELDMRQFEALRGFQSAVSHSVMRGTDNIVFGRGTQLTVESGKTKIHLIHLRLDTDYREHCELFVSDREIFYALHSKSQHLNRSKSVCYQVLKPAVCPNSV